MPACRRLADAITDPRIGPVIRFADALADYPDRGEQASQLTEIHTAAAGVSGDRKTVRTVPDDKRSGPESAA